MRLTRRRFAALCASAAAAPRAARAQAAVTIHAAITPIYYDAMPILYGQKTGAFERAGIDLQLGRLATGAAITAAVTGGSLDLGKSTVPAVISAFARGIPLAIVAPGAIYDVRTPNDGLVVAKDSPIHGPVDLAGKVIAVNSLGDPTKLALSQWLERAGQSADGLKLVEIPMAAQMAALDAHRVDAIVLTSPIMDDVLATGRFRIVTPALAAIAPRFLFSAYFARREWADANRDAVRRFAATIEASGAYLNAHHAEMTDALADLTGAEPASIARMTWPTGGTALVPSELQPVIDIAAKYGQIPKRVDARAMLFDSNH